MSDRQEDAAALWDHIERMAKLQARRDRRRAIILVAIGVTFAISAVIDIYRAVWP